MEDKATIEKKSKWEVVKETIRRLRGRPEEGAEVIAEQLPKEVMPLEAVKKEREKRKKLDEIKPD